LRGLQCTRLLTQRELTPAACDGALSNQRAKAFFRRISSFFPTIFRDQPSWPSGRAYKNATGTQKCPVAPRRQDLPGPNFSLFSRSFALGVMEQALPWRTANEAWQ
jgi:hypothetical protein